MRTKLSTTPFLPNLICLPASQDSENAFGNLDFWLLLNVKFYCVYRENLDKLTQLRDNYIIVLHDSESISGRGNNEAIERTESDSLSPPHVGPHSEIPSQVVPVQQTVPGME